MNIQDNFRDVIKCFDAYKEIDKKDHDCLNQLEQMQKYLNIFKDKLIENDELNNRLHDHVENLGDRVHLELGMGDGQEEQAIQEEINQIAQILFQKKTAT